MIPRLFKRQWFLLGLAGLLCATFWLLKIYYEKKLINRADIILTARMISVSKDWNYVVIEPMGVYKGSIQNSGPRQFCVDALPWWRRRNVIPPWPHFQTNGVLIFYLRKSFWSSTYEPLRVDEKSDVAEGYLARHGLTERLLRNQGVNLPKNE